MNTTTTSVNRGQIDEVTDQEASDKPDLAPPESRKGPIDHVSVQEVMERLPQLPWWSKQEAARFASSTFQLLTWLSTFPGDGWQERWSNAEATYGVSWRDWTGAVPVVGNRDPREHHDQVTRGLRGLIHLRLVSPSYEFLKGFRSNTLYSGFRQTVSVKDFDRAAEAVRQRKAPFREVNKALNALTMVAIHTGKTLDEVTTDDLRQFHQTMKQSGRHSVPGFCSAWQVMVDIGFFPEDNALKDPKQRGQETTAQLVDFYKIKNRPIRDLLVRYLEERRPSLDYGTFRNHAQCLAGVFWANIEAHHPGIDTIDRTTTTSTTGNATTCNKARATSHAGCGGVGQSRINSLADLF